MSIKDVAGKLEEVAANACGVGFVSVELLLSEITPEATPVGVKVNVEDGVAVARLKFSGLNEPGTVLAGVTVIGEATVPPTGLNATVKKLDGLPTTAEAGPLRVRAVARAEVSVLVTLVQTASAIFCAGVVPVVAEPAASVLVE